MFERNSDDYRPNKARKYKKINQTIICHDYVFQQADVMGLGEFRGENFYHAKNAWHTVLSVLFSPVYEFEDKSGRECSLTRLFDLIRLLSTIVNEYHCEENFYRNEQGDWLVKEGKENTISRLVMHEFALYPAKKPLSASEFQRLKDNIEKMAAGLKENLHLMLSSIPLLHDNAEVTNHVIHVQCGKKPILTILKKENASKIDPVYPDTSYPDPKSKAQEKEKESSLCKQSFSIPINETGIVLSKTLGRAKFYTVVEICYDHQLGVGLRNYHQELELALAAPKKKLRAKQLSQVVVANGMSIWPNRIIAKSVLLVDQGLKKPYSNHGKIRLICPSSVSLNAIQAAFSQTYPDLEIIRDQKRIIINAPPFGAMMLLTRLSPYRLNKIKDLRVAIHNEKIINGLKPPAEGFKAFKKMIAEIKAEVGRRRILSFAQQAFSPIQQLNLVSSASGKLKNKSALSTVDTHRFFSGSTFPARQNNFIDNLLQDLDRLMLSDDQPIAALWHCIQNYKEEAKHMKCPRLMFLLSEVIKLLKKYGLVLPNIDKPSQTISPRWDF